jgi:hypothetical protein
MTAMAWESARVFSAVSASCAIIFLLYLPVRFGELRGSSTKTSPGTRGPLKAVNINLPLIRQCCHYRGLAC